MIRNKELKTHLDHIDRRLDLMDRSLVLHNPDSTRAAEMFDGLRKTVIRSLNVTQALQAGLAQLDQIAESTDDIEDVRAKLNELMDAAAVRKVRNSQQYREAFDVLGSGPVETVARSAYVADTATGAMIIVKGVVELSETHDPPPPLEQELTMGDVDSGGAAIVPVDHVPGHEDSADETDDHEGASK